MSFVPASVARPGGSAPWHFIKTHLLGDTKPRLSTCHQTVTACPVPGNPTGQPFLHCGVPHCPLQGRAFLPFTPPHWKRLSQSGVPLPVSPTTKQLGAELSVSSCVAMPSTEPGAQGRTSGSTLPPGHREPRRLSFGLPSTLENRVSGVQPSGPGAKTAPSPYASQGRGQSARPGAPRQGQ